MPNSFANPAFGHPRTRRVLLAGVSVSALATALLSPAAAAPRVFSPAWFAARVDASTGTGTGTAGAATLGQATTASRNLATLTTRLQQLQATEQAAASAAAIAASTIPNGLGAGGLQIQPGATAGSPAWTGADLPTQTQSAGRDAVTITQTAPQAILTWQTFNVGSKTDLVFNQSAGGSAASGWVALNRVEDPAAQPSQILGSITAPGKVYIINANGIVFGAGAQISLGALIASTAAITNSQFTAGLYAPQDGATFDPTFTGAAAGSLVMVDQGAQITTATPSSATAGGGYVMLLGGAVDNDGFITTPQGQTVLAAGENFILRPGYSTSGNQTATVQGSQIATTGTDGAATNTGLITAPLGDITIAAHDVTQAGVVLSTTSVNTRGTVHLLNSNADATGSITLAPNSVTSVNPDNAATTALDSQRSADLTQSAANNALRATSVSDTNPQLNDVGTLPDLLDESRIEIVTGGTVSFQGSSLTLSQGGQIAVQAAHAVTVQDGAALDVSGSTGAVLPASSNDLTVNIQGNELRDAPVNRDTGLISSTTVSVDINDLVQLAPSSADAATRDYTAGGLLEVSGYVSNIGHTIDEWAAVGGTIRLDAKLVVTAPQAQLNVAGGSVAVQGGDLAQSYLIGADGQLYNVNTAPANIEYLGVYDGFTVTYARFGGSDTYASKVATPAQIYQNGYSYGRDAGSVVVTAQTAALEAQIDAGVSNGAQQTGARAPGVTDPYTYTQSTIALPGTLAIGGFTTTGSLLTPDVVISDSITPVADSIIATQTVPAGVIDTVKLSAAQLDNEGLGGLSIITGGAIDVSAPLTLAPGGALTLDAAQILVGASLTARGGSITLANVVTNPVNGAATPLLTDAAGGGVVVNNAARLDVRGQWTNAAIDAVHVSGEALVNGGTLTVDSLNALAFSAGTAIDASSGGAQLASGQQIGGTAGSISLTGDDPQYGAADASVLLAATITDDGVDGGGTLSLTAPHIVVGPPATGAGADTVLLAAETFQSGFSDYVINGFDGLRILPGTIITVAEPIYAFYGQAQGTPAGAPTGTDPSAVFQLILPPAYAENQATARLTQRKGASVAFIANNRPGQGDYGGGAIDIGTGAAITVDAGQSVRIEAAGQITDDGAITAPGGSVSLINQQREVLQAADPAIAALSLSVWVGSDASINVAGIAVTAPDALGRPYGLVTPGGTVTLGSDGGVDTTDSQIATDAVVIVRPGALIDASGASATIDLLAGTPPQLAARQLTPVPSDPVIEATGGGGIYARSYSGVDLDGSLLAASGGAGAAGGSLSVTLETPTYPVGTAVPPALSQPHEITISQTPASPLSGLTLAPGQLLPATAYGQANVSQTLLDQGGFAALSLYARDAFVFAGNVALSLPGSIALTQGIIADTAADATVTLSAPYVKLAGETPLADNATSISINNTSWHPYADATTGSFVVDADLIDIAQAVRFGVSATATLPPGPGGTAPTLAVSLPGFANIALASSGDIRFGTGSLTTPGNLALTASQLYPVTGAVATVFAGYDEYSGATNLYVPTGSITVSGNGVTPAAPYSVGGSLALYAGAIVQDGIIRAPEGSITLGAVGIGPDGLIGAENPGKSFSTSVSLLPGSITSVSLDGQTVPYGGTVDGVSYTYNGSDVGGFNPSITLAGQTQQVNQGATLDLGGGGTLSGAGFISGRGGSVNVLTTPFVVFDAASGTVSAPTLSSQPVYALLPGYDSAYAPTSPVEASGSDGSVPAVGAQISIAAGVPGIVAGTYTLLPSYYALLPGAVRVQVDTGQYDPLPGVTPLGANSYELNATLSTANTGVAGALPVQVVVTNQAGIAADAEFDTQSYGAFELAQAAQYGAPRGALPQDGKTLNLIYPATAATTTALDFAGTALLAAASGGFAGQVTAGGIAGSALQLEVTADGAAPSAGFTSIEASQLDAIGAPRLIIGGTLQHDASIAAQLDFIGTADQVVVRGGADLHAPELFLTAGADGRDGNGGAITVADGAVLDTVGAGPAPFDSSNGYFYNAFGYSLVALSNGQLAFTTSTNAQNSFGPIAIDDGASLFTGGTMTFVTTAGLTLGTGANYGARDLAISVDTINIVSDAALAASAAGTLTLPAGVTLTQDTLTRLLQGDPDAGTPGLQSLVLTADGAINFAGSVALDTLNAGSGSSSLQQLVLNTPAILGTGTAGDVASISTGTLYWNGVETTSTVGATSVASSALPSGVAGNGPGTGGGTLNLIATNIVLGYGPNTTPDDQTTLNRLVEGFATVNLQASGSISGADRGTLSVYQTAGATYGTPGTGGTLNIVTPLLTGAAGSVDAITAGGALDLTAPAGGSTATEGALGAEVDLAGATITDATTVLLNSGRLTMTATAGDIDVQSGARIDLAGAAITLLDQTSYSSGGSLVLSAGAGNITAQAGSSIDISASGAAAGSISATALAGAADFAGTIDGNASSGQAAGSFSLRAGTLPSFDALNEALTAGGVFGGRSFELADGNIDVDQTVQAHSVRIVADSGTLTVASTIDASGAAPGSITLAAGGNLTVADGALLQAQGTVLQTDSTGAAIQAENRGSISLTTTGGTLSLGAATLDVASADSTDFGQVLLYAPRILANGAETGDVAVDASAAATIIGAQVIALYGTRTYTPADANGTISQHAITTIAGSVSLDQIDADNTSFIDQAAGNASLAARTAGLSAYGGAYHLRPADTIESSAASGGNLTVDGDLDLSGLRYGPGAAGGQGAGEVGLLSLRAADNLVVNGSITDGFAPPPDATTPTRDDSGWVLYSAEPLGQAVSLPVDLPKPVVLANGTTFSTANPVALNYPITIAAATLGADVVIPASVTIARGYTIPAGGVTATAAITGQDGTVIATAGQVLSAGTLIPAGSTLASGSVLPFAVTVVPHTIWPAGASLSLFTDGQLTLDIPRNGTLTLAGGASIPIGTSLVFASGASYVPLRTRTDGQEGLIYATANLLPAGSQSWSIDLVAGANLASADVLAVQPATLLTGAAASPTDPAGSLVLDDTHYTESSIFSPTASFSVIRTGTGSLNLAAGGNVDEASLFGVYTAGTQTSLGAAADAQFALQRADQGSGGTVLGANYKNSYGAVIAGQQTNYPDGGGDVRVAAQNDVLGDSLQSNASSVTDAGSDAIGNWLWKQGGTGLDQSTAWSINFGSYVLPLDSSGNVTATQPVLVGFTGIGALGGGNVTVVAGGDAGEVSPINSAISPISQGLVIAVASTGRVTGVTSTDGTVTGGTTVLTGGGTLTLDVAGTLNPALQSDGSTSTLGGTLTDMRGDITVQAGQVGRIDLDYNVLNTSDPRPQDPYTTQFATSSNGLIVVPGDGSVSIATMRDLVLAGAGDPGRESAQALTAVPSVTSKTVAYAGDTGFTLWTDATEISLQSAGGNLTPTTSAANDQPGAITNDAQTDYRYLYPSTLNAVAASGSLYYGAQGSQVNTYLTYSLELAPSPDGELSLLAANSIYAHGYAIDMSGADNGLASIPNPFNPAYTDNAGNPFGTGSIGNILDQSGNVPSPNALFAFQADTPTTDLHATDSQPNRVYAATGDLVDVQIGEVINFATDVNEATSTWYLAAKPTDIMAGQDIVGNGTQPQVHYSSGFANGAFSTYPNQRVAPDGSNSVTSGDLLLNLNPTDASVVSAGRDILGSYFYVAGPGLLEVDAGRNITETGGDGLAFGVLKSVGTIIDVNPATRTGGAGIAVLTGTGSIGPDYSAFSSLYFNAANQADLAIPLSDPANDGKVQQTYQAQLLTWLQTTYAYTGSGADALSYFATLPAVAQDVFVRSVFFEELQASGQQESDPDSLFYKSYARGRTAIATLFPATDAAGNAITYDGSLTMQSGTLPVLQSDGTTAATVFDAGISTQYGGTVQILSPGGQDVFGTEGGPTPGANSGVITYGSGDIDIYALDSVELGESRIFTTFGGSILIWSAQGDINAGRGSKTTQVYQPPLIAYDSYGGITLSPAAVTSGAGIATLTPIAGTAPGDVDLIAPEGTVDAGEAGIRVSGNLNIAALMVLNAANVQVQGKTTGNTAAVATNTTAAIAAASTAASSVSATTNAVSRPSAQGPAPSTITVEIIADNDDETHRRRPAA